MAAMALFGDRRRRKRLAVHWLLRLVSPGRPPIVTTTENLTSEGLYCIVNRPFKPGERLQCEIVIPGENFDFHETSLRLQCSATVKRVEYRREGFGLGCQIDDYALAPASRSATAPEV